MRWLPARTLDSVPDPARTLVGMCTFDSCAHFYKLTGSSPQMLVVPDAEEPHVSLPAGLAVPPARTDALDATLKQIRDVRHKQTRRPRGHGRDQSVRGGAQTVGGRVLAFMGTMPTGGYGGLKSRAAPGRGRVEGGG